MQQIKLLLLFIVFYSLSSLVNAEAIWGAKYFPNVELTDHNGKKMKFFDDMIKDKIVPLVRSIVEQYSNQLKLKQEITRG